MKIQLCLVMLALAALAAIPSSAADPGAVTAATCTAAAAPGLKAAPIADCVRPVVLNCFTTTTTRERPTVDDYLTDDSATDCATFLTGVPSPCHGVSCGVLCESWTTCTGTFYTHSGTSRTAGVMALGAAAWVDASPSDVQVHYGASLTHCQAGVHGIGSHSPTVEGLHCAY